MKLTLEPGQISLSQLRAICNEQVHLQLPASALALIDQSAALVQAAADGDAPVYGVNTGFGKLASTRIAKEQLAALQLNLIRSHSVGVGAPMSPPVLRLMLATKAASLARGYSGVRREVVQALLDAFNAGFIPYVPCQGSVGASGDLAPLSHMTLALMGEGEALVNGERRPALPELQRLGLQALTLAAKEGLALINGTQASTALALHALLRFETLFASALASGALSLDAARGSDGPFDPRIHAVRGQPGQIETAAVYRALLAGSAIRASHKNPRPQADAVRHPPPGGVIQPWQSQMLDGDERVQDPYCLRCQPQVMGACLDQARHATAVLVREANAVTDNPLVFDDCMVSGGNFHAEPVALAADGLALAIAEVGAIAERRIAMLIDPGISRLPPFLTADAGLHSGFMIAHVTAAALASENKSLAHPASVDSLPTSANQEDHVSMATFAARRLHAMLDNTAHIIAIEFLAAAQGIDFLRPLQSSPALEALHAELRRSCASYPVDHYLAPDMERAAALVQAGALVAPGAPQL